MDTDVEKPLLLSEKQTQVLLQEQEEEEEEEEEGQRMSVDEIMECYVSSGFGRAQLLQVSVVAFAWIVDALHSMLSIFTDATPHCTTYDHTCTDAAAAASIVSEWGLTCPWLRGLPASLFFVGSIFGSSVAGRLSDGALGRRRTLLLSCTAVSAIGFVTSAAQNFAAYCGLRLAAGFARAGVGIMAVVLATEAVGPKIRGQVGIVGFFFFAAGFASLPGIDYLTRTSWRAMYVLVSAVSAAYACGVLLLAWDSPHWLAVHGHHEDALRALRGMALMNARLFPENVAIAAAAPALQASLWGNAWMRWRMVAVMAGAVGTGMVYYGMPLSVGNLLVNIDVHLSTLLNALVEVPATAVATVLLRSVGRRRPLLCASSCVCGALCAACAIMEGVRSAGAWRVAELVAEVGAFVGVCVAFDVWYVFCVELFPTDVRSRAVATMRQAIMAGAAAGSVVGQGKQWVSFAVFAVFSVLTALVVALVLPETAGMVPCDTVQEQQQRQTDAKAERQSLVRSPAAAVCVNAPHCKSGTV